MSQPLLKLCDQTIAPLHKGKNLLAFSAGSDSSALFHLLIQEKIDFDIALVNYKTRAQSDLEEEHAKKIAAIYEKKCYTMQQTLEQNNFEHKARTLRYAFFTKIMQDHGYDNLITAHHMGDLLEWFLMQFTKGAGLVEMLGMQCVQKDKGYTILRPLLESPKASIENYLQSHNITYFKDSSNEDEKYTRNHIRKRFTTELLQEYNDGIGKSFRYLQDDANYLVNQEPLVYHKLFILKKEHSHTDMRNIDRCMKSMGYVLSAAQRQEIKKAKESVIASKIALSFSQKHIFIAPHILLETTLPKTFKEKCRIAKIPPKIRPYIFDAKLDIDYLLELIS